MKKFLAITFIFVLMFIGCYSQSSIIDSLKTHFDFENGLYYEKDIPDSFNPTIYTIDNKVYTLNKTFFFDYFIVKEDDTLKSKNLFEKLDRNTESLEQPIDQKKIWELVPYKLDEEDVIETISIQVLNGFNDTQTIIEYKYYNKNNTEFDYSSSSGLVENVINTWLHPFRDGCFFILQFNPFPFIQQPFEIGNKWTWKLLYGGNGGNNRWITWTGSVENNYTYEIIAKEKLQTKLGELNCWVINSFCKSKLGQTELLAYYNETYGFVKLEYTNIDKSRLIIKIKDIK